MRYGMRIDERYMRQALDLARKGVGLTNPNPPVGAVIVKNGSVVGKGFHKKCGLAHAEALAIKAAGTRARGATMYVTLEPCDHFGRTPPCARSIVASGIRTVVIGASDPNPLTRGRGIRRLRAAGIRVVTGMLEPEAREMIRPFGKWITQGLPYVTVKMAQSLDGKIATRTGDSRWISSEKSRRFVHDLRGHADAVMVGITTIMRDDPRLLSVSSKGKQPARVIVDSRLRTPLTARVIKTLRVSPVYIATADRSIGAKERRYESRGARLIFAGTKRRRVDLAALLHALAELNIMHVLVEGGGEVVAGLVDAGLVDEFIFFVAPMIIGGRSAPTAVGGMGITRLVDAARLKEVSVKRFGDDVMIRAKV